MSGVYGQIITGTKVRNAVRDTIALWIPEYLADVAEENGFSRAALPPFRSYVPAIDFGIFPGDQYPACVIVAPGIAGEPPADHVGWDAFWSVGVGCVVTGRDRDETLAFAELYGAAVYALLMQHQSLGDFARGLTFAGFRTDPFLSNVDQRTVGASEVLILVDVEEVISRSGPITPVADPLQPSPEWTHVTKVIIAMEPDEVST